MSTMKKRIPMFLLALAMMVAMALAHVRGITSLQRACLDLQLRKFNAQLECSL